MKNLEKLLSDNEFIKKILEANDGKEVKQLFKEKGLDLTDEQIEAMRDAISKELTKLNSMSDKEIEQVIGGLKGSRVRAAAQEGVGYGGAWGMWAGAGIGAAAGVVDAAIKAHRGEIDSSWGFIKEATKTAIKASLLGGAVGGGLGMISGASYEVGRQGDAALSKDPLE